MKHLMGKAYKRVNSLRTLSIVVVCKEHAKLVYFDVSPVGVALNWDYKVEQEELDDILEKYSEELTVGSITSDQLLSIINFVSQRQPATKEAASILERITLGES